MRAHGGAETDIPCSPDKLLQRCPSRLDTLVELLCVEATHGMLDDNQPGLDLPRLGLCEDKGLEGVRRYDVGGNAALGEFDAVVETPR